MLAAQHVRRLGKYEVLDELGHGGMATVFRSRDTTLDRLVALKLLHPHLRGSAEARSRFRREAQSVAKLRHPNILEVFDYSGEDTEECFIAAELLTGPTLRAFVEAHAPLAAETAACLVRQIALGLAAAHEKGIIHRDVKPENVLAHEARVLKVTDFGIAALADAQSMTATGQVLGSPGHMAPEQIEGREVDARTDVFAIGTVLYFVATGVLPFTGKNPHQVLKRVIEGDYLDPLRHRPDLSPELAAILRRAMAIQPADRFASMDELIASLDAFVAKLSIDDPDAEVKACLEDPAALYAERTKAIVAVYAARGRDFASRGLRREATDCFQRVLALDESNAEVLAAVAKLGRRDVFARRLRGAVAAFGAVGAASLGVWGMSRPGIQAEVFVAPADAGPADAFARADVLPVAASDAGVEDVGLPRLLSPRIARPPAMLAPSRHVIFDLDPVNVQLAVDDGPLRHYGPAFNSIELLPGRHRFRIVSNVPCCADATFERDIPAGHGPFRLTHELASRPAILIVRSDVPADVDVQGLARGRAQTPLDVPLSEREGDFTFTVTAEGRATYTGRVHLAAGTVSTERVVLAEAP